MAESELIKHTDVAEEGLVRDYLQKEFSDLVDYLPEVEAAIVNTAKNLRDALKNFSFAGIDISKLKQLNDQLKESNDLALIDAKVKKTQADASLTLEKQKQEEIKSNIILEKQKQEEIKTNITSEKQRQEEIKTQKTLEQEEQRKQKVQEKTIKLTETEIIQAQIDAQKTKERIALMKAETVAMDQSIGTIIRLNAENTKYRILVKNKVIATKEDEEEIKKWNAIIDKNTAYIKANSDSLLRSKMNVGNYANSIKEAFEGTGLLGETINKYLSIVVTFSEKIESVVNSLFAQAAATEANTVATEANTIAEEANTVATEAAMIAEKENVATLEAQTAATAESTAANEGLVSSLKKLATNPYVIAAAALAAFTKVIYDNVTAVQSNKDELDADIEAAKAFVKNMTLGGVSAAAFAVEVRELTLRMDKLQDAEINALTKVGKLRADAAAAREDAAEENKTTREKIDLLGIFIDKSKEAFDVEIEHAKEAAKIKEDYFFAQIGLLGKEDRESRKAMEEAKARVLELEREKSRAALRAQKQQTALIEKYNDDTRKMLQDAQKQELDLLDTFSKYKAIQLTKQLAKDLKANQIETDQAIANKKHEQERLGEIDGEGKSRAAEFQYELDVIRRAGAVKHKQLTEKTNQEIAQLNIDFQEKSIDNERKFREDLNKLDEAYNNLKRTNKNQEQDNQVQENQFAIDNEQALIDKLQEQRKVDISQGKEKLNLTLKDLKQYYDVVDKLEDEHFALVKNKLKSDADFSKQNEQDKLADAINAVKEKYQKQRDEDEKAIRNKNLSPEAAKKEIETHNADLAQNQAKEIENITRNSAAVIEGIDLKLKGDLTKSDQDELKRKRAHTKELTQLEIDAAENAKKIRAEVKKAFDQATDGIQKGLAERSELQQQADQRDIDYHKRIIEVQTKIAAAGHENILAEELAAADKAEEKKIQDQKRAARIQEDITLVKTFTDTLNQALDKKEPFIKAFGEAATATGIVSAMFARLIGGSAYKGTEDTGAAGNVDEKGGKLWILHPRERVLTAEQNKKIGGISNEQLVKNILSFEKIVSNKTTTTNDNVTNTTDNFIFKTFESFANVFSERKNVSRETTNTSNTLDSNSYKVHNENTIEKINSELKLLQSDSFRKSNTYNIESLIETKKQQLKDFVTHETFISKKTSEITDGIFKNVYTPQFKSTNVSTTVVQENKHDQQLASVVVKEMRALKKAIEAKPVPTVRLGALGEWIEETERNGMKIITHHKKNRSSLRRNP